MWPAASEETFLDAIGPVYARATEPDRAQVALETRLDHRNSLGFLHGGMLAAFADHAYFLGVGAMGHRSLFRGVTLDLSMQYLGAGRMGPDLVAQVDLLRETGRLMFLRMVMTQEGQPVAASSATLRKASASR